MEGMVRMRHIPSFGNWDFCDELPITQYFESARQAGLLRGHSFRKDEDLFKVPPSPLPYHYRKPRKTTERKKHHHNHHQTHGRLKEQRRQGRVCDVTHPPVRRPSVPKPVDEDLYKIPPELLYQKPKRRIVLSELWKRCLRLNCIP